MAKMTHVSSSNIESIGYENGNLYVRFLSGSLYEYENVPEVIYNELMSAPSHGKYLNAHVKWHYTYHKIG